MISDEKATKSMAEKLGVALYPYKIFFLNNQVQIDFFLN